jgi:enoyl-CoA hydratase
MQYELPDEIQVTADGAIRIVTITRPNAGNAVDAQLHHGLRMVWGQLGRDVEARAVVLTGAGKHFCSGGDLEWLASLATDTAARRQAMREARELMAEMVACHLPVVAAVNGAAVGLGCSVAILADIVLMADDAFFADPHVAMGLVAGDGGAVVWPLLTSLLRAKEYVFTGKRMPALEAERLGLCNRVVPSADLQQSALELARALSELPFQAVQDTKRAFNMHVQRAMAGVVEFALAAESESLTSDDHRAKVTAFLGRDRTKS